MNYYKITGIAWRGSHKLWRGSSYNENKDSSAQYDDTDGGSHAMIHDCSVVHMAKPPPTRYSDQIVGSYRTEHMVIERWIWNQFFRMRAGACHGTEF